MGITVSHNSHITMNSLSSLLLALLVFRRTVVIATPVSTPANISRENVDEVEVVVGVEDSKIVEVNQKSAQPAKIAGSLVKDVKQINLFLNIPTGCNSIYDQLITQLVGCRDGSNRGDPRLEKGCLLKMDFKKFKDECAETGVFFPAVGETPWHPGPTCNGSYCEETSDLTFSTKSAGTGGTNVAFPGQEDESGVSGYSNRENKSVGSVDDALLVTLLDILNSKGKNGIRLGED